VIKMAPIKRSVSTTTKLLFPIVVTLVTGLLAPKGLPLMGTIMLGNFMRECGVAAARPGTAVRWSVSSGEAPRARQSAVLVRSLASCGWPDRKLREIADNTLAVDSSPGLLCNSRPNRRHQLLDQLRASRGWQTVSLCQVRIRHPIM
jgi:hypothetical protein